MSYNNNKRITQNTIFVGKLSSRVREEDLKDEFRRYGRIRDIDFRRLRGFAFIEYNSQSDAKSAVDEMNGQRFEDTRIIVQFKEGKTDRNKKGPSNVDLCFNCGRSGHWANECQEGNWNNKCYRCGKGGHLKKDCSKSRTPSSRRNSPTRNQKKIRQKNKSSSKSRSVSDSRSRSRDRLRNKKRRQSYSNSSSRSRSNSSSSSDGSRSSSNSRDSSSRSSNSSHRNKRNRRSHSKSQSYQRGRRESKFQIKESIGKLN